MTKQGWNERINCPFLLTGKMTLQFIFASNLLTKYREIIRQFKQERVSLFSLYSGIGDKFRVRARVVKESASKIVNFSVFLLRHFSVYMARKYSQSLNVSRISPKGSYASTIFSDWPQWQVLEASIYKNKALVQLQYEGGKRYINKVMFQ